MSVHELRESKSWFPSRSDLFSESSKEVNKTCRDNPKYAVETLPRTCLAFGQAIDVMDGSQLKGHGHNRHGA
jgi:hypothetical protein